MYALIDCNNFFASCERVFRPDLRDKPIAVLSNNDGCVIARSNEVKALNIPMGAPAFKYKEIFQKHNVHVFSSNYTLYGDMSKRVMNILHNFSQDIEIYSIDEAFLWFNSLNPDYNKLGLEIIQKVTKSTGISISVGFADTKALTKVANKIAKKFPERTHGTYIIDSDEKRIKALKWTKIEDVWGIGRKISAKLKKIGVYTAYDFTKLKDSWINKNLTVNEKRLKKELLGESVLKLEKTKKKKSIAVTRTFDHNYFEYNLLRERVATFASLCAEKLRKQDTSCNTIIVFVSSNFHRKDLLQYSNSSSIKLPYSTNSNQELVKFALQGLQNIFKEGIAYKRAGVIVTDICEGQQLSLFEKTNPKYDILMQTMDKINKNQNADILKLGVQEPKRRWKMRQEKLSRKFTTNLNEVITVTSR